MTDKLTAKARAGFRPRAALLGLVLSLLVPGAATQAGRVKSLGIDTLTSRAGTIFSGRCVDARTIDHETLDQPVAELTFVVLRGVKGTDGRQQITVRMLAAGGLAGFPAGPGGGIGPGDEVVLFLYPASRLGLTSPVGMGQGRFSVPPDLKDGKIAVNPWGNRTLLNGVSEPTLSRLAPAERAQFQTGRVRPDTLLDVAEKLTRQAAGRAAAPVP